MRRRVLEGQGAFDWDPAEIIAEPVETPPAPVVSPSCCHLCKGPHKMELTRDELRSLIRDVELDIATAEEPMLSKFRGMRARWEAKLKSPLAPA